MHPQYARFQTEFACRVCSLSVEEQAGRAEHQDAGDLLSDAEGSVVLETGAEAAMPTGDSILVTEMCTAPQLTRVVKPLLRALQKLKTRLRRLSSKSRIPPIM
jgi:hypothetical protein